MKSWNVATLPDPATQHACNKCGTLLVIIVSSPKITVIKKGKFITKQRIFICNYTTLTPHLSWYLNHYRDCALNFTSCHELCRYNCYWTGRLPILLTGVAAQLSI